MLIYLVHIPHLVYSKDTAQKDLIVSAEEQKALRHRTSENLASCTNRR